MRGGIFDLNYQIEKWDFDRYLKAANSELYSTCSDELSQLGDDVLPFRI